MLSLLPQKPTARTTDFISLNSLPVSDFLLAGIRSLLRKS